MQTTKHTRLPSIDILRGILMVLMALDHANYFISQQHSTGEYWGGPFPAYSDASYFVVRWVTHLSAPGFALLLGVGMALLAHNYRQRGISRANITGHFIIRGLVLIAVQHFLVIRLWELSPGGWGVPWYFGTLWALGGSMILCSKLVWQDARILAFLAIVMGILVEIATPSPSAWGQSFSFLDYILLVPGGRINYWVNYPILQWTELVIFGIVVGKWIAVEGFSPRIRKRLLITGLGMLAAFAVLRAWNGFGNIRPRAGDSWMDVLNPVKYPPSLTYTLLTTGINLLLLAFLARFKDKHLPFSKPLRLFGREPLFFYVQHLAVYAGMSPLFTPGGTSLRVMVFVWLLGLVQLVIPCAIYTRLKRHSRGWLREVLRYF